MTSNRTCNECEKDRVVSEREARAVVASDTQTVGVFDRESDAKHVCSACGAVNRRE
jgi:hypothetical protein